VPSGTDNLITDHDLYHSVRSALVRSPWAAAIALLCIGSSSCRDTFRVVGPNAAVAENRAAQLFTALAARYSLVERDPKYDAARMRLSKAALVPSKVFDDTVVWSAHPSAGARVLFIQGALTDGRYRLEARPTPAAPVRAGESRHSISLQRVAERVYRWDTSVDFAIGSITAADVDAAFGALIGAVEGRAERDVTADYRGAFPRTAAAFGRGFSIDSLHVTPGALGTAGVMLTIGFHPERMAPTHPAFASYLDKYLQPARYRLTLTDASNAVMFDVIGRDRALTLRYRVQRGRLVSLYGPPRPLSDTLQLHADLSAKVKMFRVGFHNLLTEFVITRTPHERAWTIVARREPDWDLPLATEHVIRSPLRQPFEGAGSLFQIGVRDSAGAQTLLGRRARLEVQESAIMRFIGSLGAHAMSELADRTEVEQDRFLREGFVALQADIRALSTRWAVTENATER